MQIYPKQTHKCFWFFFIFLKLPCNSSFITDITIPGNPNTKTSPIWPESSSQTSQTVRTLQQTQLRNFCFPRLTQPNPFPHPNADLSLMRTKHYPFSHPHPHIYPRKPAVLQQQPRPFPGPNPVTGLNATWGSRIQEKNKHWSFVTADNSTYPPVPLLTESSTQPNSQMSVIPSPELWSQTLHPTQCSPAPNQEPAPGGSRFQCLKHTPCIQDECNLTVHFPALENMKVNLTQKSWIPQIASCWAFAAAQGPFLSQT